MGRLSLSALRTCWALLWVALVAASIAALLMVGWVVDSRARPDLYPGTTAEVAVVWLCVSLVCLATIVYVLLRVRKHLRAAESLSVSEHLEGAASVGASEQIGVARADGASREASLTVASRQGSVADTPCEWRSDPTRRHALRFWDGQRWTEHVYDDGVQGVDPYDVAVLPMKKLPLRGTVPQWRIEVSDTRMSLFLNRFDGPFVVQISDIVGICNPSVTSGPTRFGFVPDRPSKIPALYQVGEGDRGNLAVVFRTPQLPPAKRSTAKFAELNFARSKPIDGFRVSVDDWPQASDAFAYVGVGTRASLPELLFEAIGGITADDMDERERKKFWRRVRTRRVVTSVVVVVIFVVLIAAEAIARAVFDV